MAEAVLDTIAAIPVILQRLPVIVRRICQGSSLADKAGGVVMGMVTRDTVARVEPATHGIASMPIRHVIQSPRHPTNRSSPRSRRWDRLMIHLMDHSGSQGERPHRDE